MIRYPMLYLFLHALYSLYIYMHERKSKKEGAYVHMYTVHAHLSVSHGHCLFLSTTCTCVRAHTRSLCQRHLVTLWRESYHSLRVDLARDTHPRLHCDQRLSLTLTGDVKKELLVFRYLKGSHPVII